jgi:hypothetical protein
MSPFPKDSFVKTALAHLTQTIDGALTVNTDRVLFAKKYSHISKFQKKISAACASSCPDHLCRKTGVCEHVFMIDDGYRPTKPKHLFYAVLGVDCVNYANIVTPYPVTGVSQYAVFNPDDSINVITYDGVAPPVAPTASSLIPFLNGIGLNNLNSLGDLVLISGLVNQTGVGPMPANLLNSKYYISTNSPVGVFTLTPLSVKDMQVGDALQIVNYVDVSQSPLAPINQVVLFDSVDYLRETIHWKLTQYATLQQFRNIRASHVEPASSSCDCGKGDLCRCQDYNAVKCIKRYTLDIPVETYIKRTDGLMESPAIRHFMSRSSGGSIIDLLKKGDPELVRASTMGLKYVKDSTTHHHKIVRGTNADYLDMSQKDIEHYIKTHERAMHKTMHAINEVGGLVSIISS